MATKVKPRTDRADYVAPGGEEHAALLGMGSPVTPEREAAIAEALAQKELRWVGRYEKTPIGQNTPPGEPLVEGFRRRRP